MSAPAVDPNEPKLRNTIAPLPATRRGYGIVLNVQPKEQKLVYTNGRVVIIRDLANPEQSILFTEHKANVSAAVFSPNGNWVASGDVEGNCMIWSYPQLKVKNTFQVAKSISDLDWDSEGTRIIAAGDGAMKARVFSWDSGNGLGEITMHAQPIISCSYRKIRPFRIATGGEDLAVNFYEGPPFKYSQTYKGHSRYPNGVRYSPDGARFASVGADSKIVIYDGSTGAVLKESDEKVPDGHKGAIYAFAWSPDSKQILTASADKTAKIWDMDNLTVVQTFTFGNDTLDQQVGAQWLNEYLITVSLSGAINYLDKENPKEPKLVLHGHKTSLQAFALDRQNNAAYTSGQDGEITRWDLSTGKGKWLKGKGHNGKVVNALLVTADNKLLSFGMDDKVRLSSLDEGTVSADGSDLGGLPVAAAASPVAGAISVAALAQDKLVLLKNTEVLQTLQLTYTPQALTFSTDGASLLVGGKDKKIHTYTFDGKTLKEGKSIDSHGKPVTSLRFAPDNSFLVSTDTEASVYVHTSPAFELKNKSGWRFHQASVKDCDWSPNSKRLVTSSLDTHLILWRDLKDFQGSERTRVKDAHIDGANIVRFVDDNLLLSIGADRAIKLWTLSA